MQTRTPRRRATRTRGGGGGGAGGEAVPISPSMKNLGYRGAVTFRVPVFQASEKNRARVTTLCISAILIFSTAWFSGMQIHPTLGVQQILRFF